MTLTIIYHIIEITLFIPLAFSIIYISFFSFCSLLPDRRLKEQNGEKKRFLVIFPAYAEDFVILESASSFLNQDYDKNYYDVVVVSDHMTDATNNALRQMPLITLIAEYKESSKAKALKLAIAQASRNYDYVIILDADNKVEPDFLNEINRYCLPSIIAIQAHRKAKNMNTNVAILDTLSEEINNSIFRRGHVNIRLSSALIGSGMCFDYSWFKEHVFGLSTAGEDKELEEALLFENKKIYYANDIPVYDEKVQSSNNFGNQRRRWIAAQIHALCSLSRRLSHAIRKVKVDYIDKFIQQLLIPRSLCLLLTPLLTITTTLISYPMGYKWMFVLALLLLSLLIAIPGKLYNKQMIVALFSIPGLVLRMVGNLLHLRGASQNFIHTKHGENDGSGC